MSEAGCGCSLGLSPVVVQPQTFSSWLAFGFARLSAQLQLDWVMAVGIGRFSAQCLHPLAHRCRHETLVAVKVLLDLEEAQKAAGPDAVWTLSNPILFNLQKECTLMASLRHPNVVQFMGFSALPPSMVTGALRCFIYVALFAGAWAGRVSVCVVGGGR